MRDGLIFWTESAKKVVQRYIPNESETVRLNENINGMYTVTPPIEHSVQLIITYVYGWKAYIVWNAAIQNAIHPCKKMQLVMGKDASEILHRREYDSIFQTFKEVKKYKSGGNYVELVLVVGKNAFSDFCKSYEMYMYPDTELIPKGKKCLYATAGGEIQEIQHAKITNLEQTREREVVSRLKRDSRFRREVIRRWGSHCIVCGESELTMLEAAHIKSVKCGGTDDPQNGYCLCANHHRMFDAALIDIDIGKGCVICSDEVKRDSTWYVGAEKNGFKLYL